MGILSRDASGSRLPGHLSLSYTVVTPSGGLPSEGHLVVRLQDTTSEATRCSEAPLTAKGWVHVGVNFGPPDLELYVDGVLQDLDGATGENGVVGCQEPWDRGIDGNDNPWIVAATGALSGEGRRAPVQDWFEGGAIDELRISDVRRPFGG